MKYIPIIYMLIGIVCGLVYAVNKIKRDKKIVGNGYSVSRRLPILIPGIFLAAFWWPMQIGMAISGKTIR